MVKIEKKAFQKLWKEEINEIEGLSLAHNNNQPDNTTTSVSKKDFVPHSASYIKKILNAM